MVRVKVRGRVLVRAGGADLREDGQREEVVVGLGEVDRRHEAQVADGTDGGDLGVGRAALRARVARLAQLHLPAARRAEAEHRRAAGGAPLWEADADEAVGGRAAGLPWCGLLGGARRHELQHELAQVLRARCHAEDATRLRCQPLEHLSGAG
eukprot:scaffold49846_cov61-Phaeocystis_antarctica.AAC.4